jgi:hypothetical protein
MMDDQPLLFESVAATPRPTAAEQGLGRSAEPGAGRLARELARRGLSAGALPRAAALVLELDRAATETRMKRRAE